MFGANKVATPHLLCIIIDIETVLLAEFSSSARNWIGVVLVAFHHVFDHEMQLTLHQTKFLR